MNSRQYLVTGIICISALLARTAISGEFSNGGPVATLSFWAGAHDYNDSEYVDVGVSAQFDARIKLNDSPFDIDFRLYANSVTFDDAFYDEIFAMTKQAHVAIEDAEISETGCSLQVLWNLNRGGIVNPYLGAGGMYERMEFSCDVYPEYRSYYNSWYYGRASLHEELSDDGFTYVARAGLEFNLNPLYLRAEASLLGEIYEEDDGAQCEITGVVGVLLTPNFRLDVVGNYYTEWEAYNALIGLSVLL